MQMSIVMELSDTGDAKTCKDLVQRCGFQPHVEHARRGVDVWGAEQSKVLNVFDQMCKRLG